MWMRLLVGQLVQRAAAQQVRSLVTEKLQDELQRGQATPAGPCDVLCIFALNAESGALTDLLEDSAYAPAATFVERSGKLSGKQVVVAEVGVGAEAAARGTADLLAIHQPKWVITAGFAGGLDARLKKGHVLMADEVVDLAGNVLSPNHRVDRSTASPGLHLGRLLTVDRLIREPQEKRALAEQHGAVACDMESFAVAEACRQAGVPWLSVRIVSDTADDLLPPEIELLLAEKSLAGKLSAAAAAIVNRFSAAGDMWQLYEDALKCSQRLARFLKGVVEQVK
jgi:adenosylhomocysteine nucleosidase